MAKYLLSKGVVVGIVFLLFFIPVNNNITAQTIVVTNETVPNGIFGLQSLLVVEWNANDTQELLEPDFSYTIPLNITYWILGGPFSQLILFYYMKTFQYVTVSLEIEDIPSWCTADLTTPQLQFPITNVQTTKITVLTVSVDYTAPAFEPFYLKIHASVNDTRGPYGILPLIQGCEVVPEIGFVSAYMPLLGITLGNYIYITTPKTPVVAPILVQNLGNGDTTVDVDIIDKPQDWYFILGPPQLQLAVNESKVMNLSIFPPMNSHIIQTIIISFTPYSSSHPTYQGEPHYVYIMVEVRS